MEVIRICNIHILMALNTRLTKDDTNKMRVMLSNGSITNNDAWGVTDGHTIKGKSKRYRNNSLREFIGKRFIIGHNRLATQGTQIQPIKYKKWIVAHNGILDDFTSLNTQSSDTYLFIKDFVNHLGNSKRYVRKMAKYFETVDGYYSLFLINTKDNRVFYVKNYRAYMEFSLIKEEERYLLYGSTDNENIKKTLVTNKYGFEINEEDKEVESFTPENEIIYELTNKKGIVPIAKYEFDTAKHKKKYGNKTFRQLTSEVAEEEEGEYKVAKSGFSNGWDEYQKWVKGEPLYTEEEIEQLNKQEAKRLSEERALDKLVGKEGGTDEEKYY